MRESSEREAEETREPTAVPHRWRNLASITGVEVVDNAESGLLATLFPAIAAGLRLDNGHLGILSAAGRFIAIPVGPFWVWLASRIGRRNALLATTVVGGTFGIAAGFSQGFWQLLLLNTLMSASLIGGSPITHTVIADSFDDRSRGRATGYYYGTLTAVSSFIGPVLALFTGSTDGWRTGMWVIGGICVLAGAVILVFYRDPGVGASERQLADLNESQRVETKVSLRSVLSLFRIPTFTIMMFSRLLSGHLLISTFGIQFLVTERGFDNATAALVLIPFGIGYAVATFVAGFVVSFLDRVLPGRGRVTFNVAAQVLFAAAAFFGTQLEWPSIGHYAVFWALMGAFQGMNPPVNRPIVMAVVLPELRGQAFAIYLTIFQTIAYGVFSLSAGFLADAFGIRGVFLWVLVVLMLLNALLLAFLFRTYGPDAAAVEATLDRRRREARRDQ